MRNIPLYRKIEQHYLDLITNGTLKHNDRLPTEYQLMDQFKVSRITVIKAMKELEKRGVIVRHTKTGTFVNCRNRNILRQLTIPIVLPYNNLLNFDIIQGAQKFALINSAVIPFYNTYNDPKQEREILLSLERMNIDGLLFYPCSGLENLDILSRFSKKKIPLVFLDRELLGTSFPLVTSDNFGGMHKMVKSLVRAGYRKFGYYGVSKKLISTEKDRFEGFCAALLESGIEIRSEWLFELDDESVEKFRYAQPDAEDADLSAASERVVSALETMEERPDIICCTNDYNAASLAKEAEKRGIAVPDSLAITGFDGLSIAAGNAELTTVAQDFDNIGRTALDLVCKMISGEVPEKLTAIPTKPAFGQTTKRREEL